MAHIKALYIKGFKKFPELTISFNENMNILVGENEAGKSTILEAIKVVLNQQYKNTDKSILKDLFNRNQIDNFNKNSSIETLPRIQIELDLVLEANERNTEYFYGENNRNKCADFGIKFECTFNEDIGSNLIDVINSGEIPYEYYNLSWTTYSKQQYYLIRRPLNFISIDTSENDTNSSFNYFNRTLFNSRYSEEERIASKNKFRNELNKMFKSIELDDIDEHRQFGINDKKVILESVLSVYENSIALENKGSGMSSLIKTQIALDKSKNNLDVILMEEPENHLCHTNLRAMLSEIEKRQSDSQIIIATHNSLIASRLNLQNIIWINNYEAKSLNSIPTTDAKFFIKADNNNFLQLLLSKKAILVEGATEFLLLPLLYTQITGRTLEEDKISVISCNGISYSHYLSAINNTDKKIAILTDNDRHSSKIEKASAFNNENLSQHIFMDNDATECWTWEACFYKLNKETLENLITVEQNAKYLFYEKDYGQVLGKMLNNKVDTAYKMLESDIQFEIPQYIKEAIEWLNK